MEHLMSKKRTLKGKVTRVQNAIDNNDTTPLTETEINLLVQRLDQLGDDSDQLLDQFSALCNDDEYAVFEEEFGEIETRVRLQKTFLHQLLKTTNAANHQSNEAKSSASVKLPRLELPNFSGNYNDWLSFHDLFVATVHSNVSLSGAQKLQYLKASLRGEAALLLQSIQVTDGNYNEAWGILTKRYENKREIVSALLERMFTQPCMNQESASALRKLIDTTTECIRSMQVLNVSIDHWDPILVHLVSKKLDIETRRQWELSLKSNDLPKFNDLTEFLDQRARALSAAGASKPRVQTSSKVHHKQLAVACHGTLKTSKCVCDANDSGHSIYKCETFLNVSPSQRASIVKKNSLCFNCLRGNHTASKCQSGTCKKCGGRHHTLLHFEGNVSPSNKTVVEDTKATVNTLFSRDTEKTFAEVLLCTAVILVQDANGQQHPCRALLDSASQATFVTENCAQRLGLQRQRTKVAISGLSAAGIGTASSSVQLNISSNVDKDFAIIVTALLLPKVTGTLPRSPCQTAMWTHIQNLKLADPQFYQPGHVDILLGADVFADLMREGRLPGPSGSPTAMNTVFGWVLSGCIKSQRQTPEIIVHHTNCNLEVELHRFWELEEVPKARMFTPEQRVCEDIFINTHTRDNTGRFTVKLPFKDNASPLGKSRDIAVRRFQQLERRMSTQPTQWQQYQEFVQEYINLGHMEEISSRDDDCPSNSACYLPHHAVTKEASTTTKLRVVFDASAKTASGTSLNDQLMVGPTLQDDMVSLLLRFRTHKVALSADIAKMYRMIRVDSSHVDFQRIVWRQSPDHPLKDYRLVTVTYGTASAPYLATRCLQQLAYDEGKTFPVAAPVVLRDFYVDDLLSGAEGQEEALTLQHQLIHLLKRGGFHLRKWSSNDPVLLESLPPELRETNSVLRIHADDSVKTLGIQWHPRADYFAFKVERSLERQLVTKRQLLSDMAKTFDPLGWLSPTTITAKILFQELWRLNLGWDECLPDELQTKWWNYNSELKFLEDIKIDRCITTPLGNRYELHGFCDASERAYAAVVYLRTIDVHSRVSVHLMAAKTKVAPIKQITLPRLELCGALLLAKLVDFVHTATAIKIQEIHAWSDSTVVLHWLSAHPSRWKTFVANRVSEIQETIPSEQWHHVSGETNPADCASRGVAPSMLRAHPLWWHGPQWLQEINVLGNRQTWESTKLAEEEERVSITVAHVTVDMSWLQKYSSLSDLQRITAYCLRFISNVRIHTSQRVYGCLSTVELQAALRRLIKLTQSVEFSREIQCCSKGQPIPTDSRLRSLNPFIDEAGVMRVGGRLRHSALTTDQRFPVLLPRNNHLTTLIIVYHHIANLHAGPQLLLATLLRQFWVVNGRDVVRHIVRKCTTCVRQRAQTAQQLMGDLPAARVNPARPFSKCGVDYAGPFLLREIKSRGRKHFKGYIALFICFTTRAIHLELVSDLTTDAFIAALKRFMSRRGKCQDIYSDRGTNFVGANKELQGFLKLTNTTNHNNTVARYLGGEGVNWHFNPPASPQFGGLWEAGVKSVKFHLRRVVGNSTLNYEEMTTVLCQIEACLNSRPLTQLSSDPNDLQALTPGHFLIGAALTSVPEPDYTEVNSNRLSRWQFMQRLLQHFWRRWNGEYLSRLQQRPRWWGKQENLEVDQLVLLKDERLPPLKWKLGRIKELHPGADQCVRVASVSTADGLVQRSIRKLCPLPIDQ